MKLPKFFKRLRQPIVVTITPKRALVALLVAVVMGLTIYQLNELRGLRARVHTLESSGYNEWSLNKAYESESVERRVDFKEVSKSTERLKVIKNYSTYYDGDPEYETKEVLIYKVEVTNNQEWAYDYYDADIRGKTNNGLVISGISPWYIHEDDKKAKEDAFTLTPGGRATVYIYFEANSGVDGLYFNQAGY